MCAEKLFYTYVDRLMDGRVFYVGKGQGPRDDMKDRNDLHREIVQQNGGTYTRDHVLDTDSEQEAFDEEKRLITYYNTNVKVGGWGANKNCGGGRAKTKSFCVNGDGMQSDEPTYVIDICDGCGSSMRNLIACKHCDGKCRRYGCQFCATINQKRAIWAKEEWERAAPQREKEAQKAFDRKVLNEKNNRSIAKWLCCMLFTVICICIFAVAINGPQGQDWPIYLGIGDVLAWIGGIALIFYSRFSYLAYICVLLFLGLFMCVAVGAAMAINDQQRHHSSGLQKKGGWCEKNSDCAGSMLCNTNEHSYKRTCE